MSSLLCWSLLAISFASSGYSNPLSTSPYNVPHQRSPLTLAPLMAADHPHGTINNSYIVMLKHDVPSSIMHNHLNFLAMAHQFDPFQAVGDVESGLRHVYDGHIKGYAGVFTDAVVERIREMPEVDFIERDQIVRTMNVKTQRSAPWVSQYMMLSCDQANNRYKGLARISHRPKLSLGTFTKYIYDTDGGDGVDVYVIDTGININHVEFEGRASWGKTIPANDVDEDGNGHGTHCAGTIASRAYGVAKAANVIAVKVLGSNGSGSMADVVQGVVWAATRALAKAAAARAEFAATGKTKHKGSIANMSLGGGSSKALDGAVNKAVDAGLHFAVAAGMFFFFFFCINDVSCLVRQ
jgi:cerevisin